MQMTKILGIMHWISWQVRRANQINYSGNAAFTTSALIVCVLFVLQLNIPDSPSTLESSLSPAELVPFHGCVIPPLTPQWNMSSEDGMVCSNTEADTPSEQDSDGTLWKDIAQCDGRALEDSTEINNLVNLFVCVFSE